MLKPVKFANAVALVLIVLQLLYYFAYIGVGQDYILSALLNVLITAVVAWVAIFAVIWLYNRWDKCCGGKCDDGKCGDKCCNDSCCGK